MNSNDMNEKAIALVNSLLSYGINGIGPLVSAEVLAEQYKKDKKYKNNTERINSLINWEASKNFTTGFLTGLGGILTLPVAIPANIGASWVVQARMVAAIVKIKGYDLSDDRVKTFILLSIVGNSAKEVLKDAGIKVGNKITLKIIEKIPGKTLVEINKKVGFRLLTKMGEKGAINLVKFVPLAGGVIGGTFDCISCFAVGRTALAIFGENDDQCVTV